MSPGYRSGHRSVNGFVLLVEPPVSYGSNGDSSKSSPEQTKSLIIPLVPLTELTSVWAVHRPDDVRFPSTTDRLLTEEFIIRNDDLPRLQVTFWIGTDLSRLKEGLF